MFNIIKRRSTHASKLERWLGPNKCAEFSALHKNWYGPPIALAGVPGEVYCRGGGDFVGNIDAGGFSNLWDHYNGLCKKFIRVATREQKRTCGTGFATLQAMIDAAKTGYAQTINLNFFSLVPSITGLGTDNFNTAQNGVVVGGAAPSGTVYNGSSKGAKYLRPCQSGKTLTVACANAGASGNQTNMMIADRLFAVAKTMNSTASEAVSGVPTRYQSTTSTDPDWAGGNFVYPLVTTNVPATAHNHNVCQYTDQSGNTGISFPTLAGRASTNAGNMDMASPNWFMPLAEGDTGVLALTQIQIDALVATGAISYVQSHPIAWVPALNGTSGQAWLWINNTINSAMQLVRIFDDACLYALAPASAGGSSTAIIAEITAVEG
jgi:hypothetical protein